MKVLLLSSEVADIVKSGGLADVAKALPLELQSRGHDVKVVLPCYSIIKGWQDLPIIAEGVLNQSHPDVKLHRKPSRIRTADSTVMVVTVTI